MAPGGGAAGNVEGLEVRHGGGKLGYFLSKGERVHVCTGRQKSAATNTPPTQEATTLSASVAKTLCLGHLEGGVHVLGALAWTK